MQTKKSLLSKLKNIKGKEFVIAAVLGVALVMILFSSFGGDNAETKATSFSPETYAAGLEKKIESVLKSMEGAGSATVAVTVASGMESVPYLKEDGTPLLSGGKVVVLTENYPKIVGVVVVCEGATSYLTKLQISNAVCALLNVSEDCVRVYPKAS